MVREGHLLYNQDGALHDGHRLDGMGGKMFRQEFSIIRPLRDLRLRGHQGQEAQPPLTTSRRSSTAATSASRATGIWTEVRRQLLGYQARRRKLEQDAVMALAIAVQARPPQPREPLSPTLIV
jgi:hypothetical protein